jgi:hypothetical protein
MAFRRYGGLNYAATNNIIRNHYQTSDNFSISDILGQYNSKIVSESHLDMSGNSLLNVETIYFMNGTSLSTSPTIGQTGSQGAQGQTGLPGSQGQTGAQGARGITGSQGQQGITGSQGQQGITGTTGPSGTTIPVYWMGQFAYDLNANPAIPNSNTVYRDFSNNVELTVDNVNRAYVLTVSQLGLYILTANLSPGSANYSLYARTPGYFGDIPITYCPTTNQTSGSLIINVNTNVKTITLSCQPFSPTSGQTAVIRLQISYLSPIVLP